MTKQIQFPSLQSRDLTGECRLLPDAFMAPLTLVFVAFRREQQTDIDSWGPWLARVANPAGVAHVEVPVLGRQWKPFRSFIDGGMAAAIRDPDVRRATLTVYGGLEKVTTPLGITSLDRVWIFLVARGGTVLHTTTGPFSDDGANELWRVVNDYR